MAGCNVVQIAESFRRGDSYSFDIVIEGGSSVWGVNTIFYFTAKQNRQLTSPRYISKSSETNGGLTVVKDTPTGKTTITVEILPEDTQDLQFDLLECDIEAQDSVDSEFIETPASGQLSICYDVRTEFDGYDLPDIPVEFQQVDASDFQVNSLMWVQTVGGKRTMVEITIDELKTVLGI